MAPCLPHISLNIFFNGLCRYLWFTLRSSDKRFKKKERPLSPPPPPPPTFAHLCGTALGGSQPTLLPLLPSVLASTSGGGEKPTFDFWSVTLHFRPFFFFSLLRESAEINLWRRYEDIAPVRKSKKHGGDPQERLGSRRRSRQGLHR